MKKLTYILIGLAVLVGSFFAFNNYIYNEKQGDGLSDVPYQAILAGVYLCLPHTPDVTGPEAEACTMGIKTDVGEYYALDTDEALYESLKSRTNSRISVSGLVVPIEQISTDHWQKFPIKGIMKVESVQ